MTTRMNLQGITLNEISQTEEDTCHVIHLIWEPKNPNQQNKMETDT